MNEYYIVGIGYKKIPHGGYKPDYQLSIPESEKHNRRQRFKIMLEVLLDLVILICKTKLELSEYILPELPSKPPSFYTPSEKKSILIKSLASSSPKPVIQLSQKPISVFLTPGKSSSNLASRKSSILDRIRSKSAIEPVVKKSATAAWERGEWCIAGLMM
jgi:hypothetical protein